MNMNEIVGFDGRAKPGPGRTVEEETEAFLRRVGDRVRDARARRGMSRRAVSDRSGVSQRYLAQLESGAGNISIALLRRVAHALDLPVEWLIIEEDPWESDTLPLLSLIRGATAAQRAQALAALDPDAPGLRRGRRVALIGLRGAGKSTLGRMGAERLGLPFLELNQQIEEASGMPVNEVFALYGQEGYRNLERQAVERVVATHEDVMLAVAGGIVSEPETFDLLLRRFHTIWLKAQPEEHMARVRRQGDERPMAGNPGAMEELRSILTSREALYARAEAVVNTSGRSVDESLSDVVETVRGIGVIPAGA